MSHCGKYLGDNDGTCPQLTCIRASGHPGLCDNVRGDDEEVEAPRPKKPWTDPRPAQNAKLLASIKRGLPQLRDMLDRMNAEWGLEDGVYRFYHQSFKVYGLQDHTTAIVNALAALADGPLNKDFMVIVNDGTGKKFDEPHNDAWLQHTRPMVEAFFHAHYFLTMVVKYGGELDEAPSLLPSGWAAVLYLYGQR